jgi:hypothetical protein
MLIYVDNKLKCHIYVQGLFGLSALRFKDTCIFIIELLH